MNRPNIPTIERPTATGATAIAEAPPPPEPSADPPGPLLLNIRAIEMTGDQLLLICADNRDLRIELTAQKELIIMPPANPTTSWQNGKLSLRIGLWAEQDGTGLCFDSSAGFTLPNGAMRSPDASWIARERWEALDEDDRHKFSHIAPDFVAELRSSSDRLPTAQAKMEEYIDNGVRLGWLIDPPQRRVYIYRPGQPVEILENPETVSGEPTLPGFTLNLADIW